MSAEEGLVFRPSFSFCDTVSFTALIKVMGKKSKVRGTGYEYRIRDWFRNAKEQADKPTGWDAERNSLSREEKSFGEVTAKHDVKAWKDTEDGRIFLQIEAKKTGKDIHTLQKEWIDKIDFTNDELLVIALNRTPHYAVITVDQYNQLNSRYRYALDCDPENAEKLIRRGKKSVRVHKHELEGITWDDPKRLVWEGLGKDLIIVPLGFFVFLREKLPPNVEQDAQTVEDDIPTVSVDGLLRDTLITCPRTSLPIKLIPNQE